MVSADLAINFVIGNEVTDQQSFVDNPADPGGATNYGISLRFVREIPVERLKKYGIFEPITVQTIKDLTIEQARLIYKCEIWDNHAFEKIENQHVCNYLFDMSVNMGYVIAIKLIQQAICICTMEEDKLKKDGICGDITLYWINSIGNDLFYPLVALRIEYYKTLALINHRNREFLDGWIKRCYKI